MGENAELGAFMAAELHSQPETWERAVAMTEAQSLLPADGERVAIVGCGTSWFIGQAYAALRENAGKGVTDAFTATEAPLDRDYDAVILLTRSGTTTEILEIAERIRGTVPVIGITGDPTSPLPGLVDRIIELPFADEQSVVQTRFATTALALLRASLGEDLSAAIAQARSVLAEDLDADLVEAEQYSFLGTGWTYGLANEAALKMRESSQSWTEAYYAMEYRHGPIAIAAPGRVTWALGQTPDGIAEDVANTGAHYEHRDIDGMAELVRVHRVALERARARGLNPDLPRNLTRSVILDA
ncbi:SIS domain-containing protein [Microbacterium gorillae]|uniref:SIS domain-containing protein n=1 Tax=Microbacterium gorillae TaxID=1231063 RepID=UPI00058C7751|nr:SIS domain-containing protein [Microbacterium gorillae]